MPVSGLVIDIGTSPTLGHYDGHFPGHMGLSVCVGRSCTSSVLTEAREDQYLDDDDESPDDDDEEYWDLDELGVDPEEFYDLCRSCTSPQP